MNLSPDNPRSWKTEDLVAALCAPGSPWTDDPKALAEKVTALDFDGETLLEAGQHYYPYESLWGDLRVRKPRHKIALGKFINELRDRGSAKQDLKRKLSPEQEDKPEIAEPSEQQEPKRKRLDLDKLVSTHQEGPGNIQQLDAIPTAADDVIHWLTQSDNHNDTGVGLQPYLSNVKDAKPGDYYGEGFIKYAAVLAPDAWVSNRALRTTKEGDEVNLVGRNRTPVGLQIGVARIHKNMLRSNSGKEFCLTRGIATKADSYPDDKSLALSDLPSDYDEATKLEIESEAEEADEPQKLSQERIRAILDESIAGIEQKWTETKLQRCARKHYKKLKLAFQKERKKEALVCALQDVKRLTDRIEKLCARIQSHADWVDESSIRDQARSLEQNVDDRMDQRWLSKALQSRELPELPPHQARPSQAVKRIVRNRHEEVLESTDDEDDFVVPDEVELEPAATLELSIPRPSGVKRELNSVVPVPPLEDYDRLESPEVIDLTMMSTEPSPVKGKSTREKAEEELSLILASPIEDSIEEIGKTAPKDWAKEGDRWRLAISMLWNFTHARRTPILQAVKGPGSPMLWETSIKAYASKPLSKPSELDTSPERTLDFDLSRIFLSFAKCRVCKERDVAPLKERNKARLLKARQFFENFINFLASIADDFPHESQIYTAEAIEQELALEEGDAGSEELNERTPSKARNKTKDIIQNKDALDLRDREARRDAMMEERRRKMKEQLKANVAAGLISKDSSRLIVNISKDADESFIRINDDNIGAKIKDYQIDGVRFLWQQLARPAEVRQGALLAHTMGLGKTMQVITFLVALADAEESQDPSIRGQVPDDLRTPRTLIICPSSLVDNWENEFHQWVPDTVLGKLVKFDSDLTAEERLPCIEKWSKERGIMIMGDGMLRHKSGEHLHHLLHEEADIVVLDEAHSIKNKDTKLNKFCGNFKTKTRIALTGSPLSNHVEEYYCIIDWIAPNFLGPPDEFHQIYVIPINAGFHHDSVGHDKRKALKVLEALKLQINPKVDRKTIKACAKEILPQKHEFVISVPATPLQRQLYQQYLEGYETRDAGGHIFEKLKDMTLICNHPSCFHMKITGRTGPKSAQRDLEGKDTVSYQHMVPDLLKIIEPYDTKPDGIVDPLLSNKMVLLDVILDEARKLKDKVLVFSQSLVTLDYLTQHCMRRKRRTMRLDGKTKPADRVDMVKGFNEGSHEVYLISTKAGGVGLNIHGANRVVIFDIEFNPTHEQQAIGRAYRLGQTKTVFVYHLSVAGTFEIDVHNRSVFKVQLASRVVDKKNPLAWANRQSALFHNITETRQMNLGPMKGKDDILDQLIALQAGTLVRSVISSDAFDEEDLDAGLTAEEHAEVNEMVKHTRRDVNGAFEAVKLSQLRETVFGNGNTVMDNGVPLTRPFGAAGSHPHGSMIAASTPATPGFRIPGLASAVGVPNDSSTPTTLPSSLPPPAPSSANSQPVGQEVFSGNISHPVAPPSTAPNLPLPVVGANTYFGQSTTPAPPASQPSTPGTTQSRNSIFLQPQRLGADAFKSRLVDAILRVRGIDSPFSRGNADGQANEITSGIQQGLQTKGSGFLPDREHWRQLGEMLEQDRFVWCILSGILSHRYLSADLAEIRKRFSTLKRLSQAEFDIKVSKTMSGYPAQEVRASPQSVNYSARAEEDARVMRNAAVNRDQRPRSPRLPEWASAELVREAGHSATPKRNAGPQRTPY